MSVLDRVGRWIDTTSPWRVLALLAVVRAATTGVWTTPNVHQWLIFASDPFGTPPIDPAAAFISGSPTGPLLADLVGAHSKLAFAVLHLVALAGAMGLLVALGRRWTSDRATNLLLVTLFASSLSAVLLTWLGQPDPFTVAGLGLVGLAAAAPGRASTVAALGGGALAGFSAFEQGLAAVVVLAVVVVGYGEGRDRATVLAALTGLVAGRLGLAWFHAASDVATLSRAEWARVHGIELFVERFLVNLPALAWSVLGAGWLLAADAARRVIGDRSPVAAVAAAVLTVGVGAIALDETRVTAIVAVPATIWLIHRAESVDPSGSRRVAPLVLLAAVVIPPVVIWEGEPVISAWRTILGW